MQVTWQHASECTTHTHQETMHKISHGQLACHQVCLGWSWVCGGVGISFTKLCHSRPWTPTHHMVQYDGSSIMEHGVAKVKKVLTRHYTVTAYAVAVVVALAPDSQRSSEATWRMLSCSKQPGCVRFHGCSKRSLMTYTPGHPLVAARAGPQPDHSITAPGMPQQQQQPNNQATKVCTRTTYQ